MILSDLLWFRTPSGGGSATIPKVRLFDANGVQTFPDPNTTQDLTISETWQTLRTLWPAGCADALRTPHGFLCDEVAEDVEVAVSPISPGASGQKSFGVATGQGIAYGTAPLGNNGDFTTVSVTGEVVTSTYSRTSKGSVSLAAIGDASSAIPVTGLNSFTATKRSGGSGPTFTIQVSADNGATWMSARGYSQAQSSGNPSPFAASAVAISNQGRAVADVSGFTYVRILWSASGSGAQVFDWQASSAEVCVPLPMDTSNRVTTAVNSTWSAHNAAVSTTMMGIGGEGRASDGTAVTSGNWVRALFTTLGALVVRNDALLSQKWKYSTESSFITTATTVNMRPAEASTIQCLKDLSVKNHSTTAVIVTIYSCATDTGVLASESHVLWRGKVDGDGPIAGSVENFTIERMTASGHAIVINTSAAGEIEINAGGYKIAG